MKLFLRLSLLVIFSLGCSVCYVEAQSNTALTYLIYKPNPNPNKSQNYVLVMSPEPLSAAPAASETSAVTRKAGAKTAHPLTISRVNFRGGSTKVIEIVFDPSNPPDPEDTEVEVNFTNLAFAGGAQPLTSTGLIYTTANLQKLKDDAIKQQKDAAAKATATDEKKIFAGFSVATPSGGDSQGNGEFNLNQWFSTNFFASLNVKKSSAEMADAKQFNISLTYRKVLLFHSNELNNFLRDQSAFSSNLSDMAKEQVVRQDLEHLQHNFLLGVLIDGSGRIEGEALNFNVTNAVFDLPVYITSRTKNFGPDGAGYFKFRIVPAGVELGRNLHNENDKMQKYYIGRFKFGGELSAIYDPANNEKAFPRRIELTLQAVDRYLFRDETAFDQATNKASGISKGHKPWYQADLKIYLSETNQGRFGFRVSRIRGGLPPTFSDTRAFTFGAIFESADDKSSQK